jgi:DNA primase
LRLQLVKQLADASGFSQVEVERLCGLRSLAPAAPPKAPRQAPSLVRAVLRLVLLHPDWVQRVPLAQLPEGLERNILAGIAESLPQLGVGANYAQLREALRGQPFGERLDALAGELLGMELDESNEEAEFSAILERLASRDRKEAFAALQAKARQFGVAGLSAEEKARYLSLLSSGKIA